MSQPHSQSFAPEIEATDTPVREAASRVIAEGTERIRRPVLTLVSTGIMGGLEIGIGLLAKYVVEQATGSDFLGALAFSIGFVILLLAHSELFTEGFLVPVAVVVAGKAKVSSLVRFWVGTMVGNLIGAAVIMFILVVAYPQGHDYFIEEGTHYAHTGLSWETFFLSALGGMMLTLVTRMHQHSDETMPKLVASMIGGAMLAGTGMLHSVLDTLYIFGALFAGAPQVGIIDWLGFVWWVILGNMAGGLFLVSGMRFARAASYASLRKQRVQEGSEEKN